MKGMTEGYEGGSVAGCCYVGLLKPQKRILSANHGREPQVDCRVCVAMWNAKQAVHLEHGQPKCCQPLSMSLKTAVRCTPRRPSAESVLLTV